MDRVRADQMGMLATTINALALEETFKQCGLSAVAMTAVEMNAFAEQYTPRAAVAALEEGKVVIFGCGLGSPFFSTDTAGALRAAEIGADALLLAKNIDGIYTADPKIDPTAVRYDDISYNDILSKELKALDLTAAAFCMDNNICAYAFELKDPMNIYRVAMGEKIGTELHR
jgi:uridylate kinase